MLDRPQSAQYLVVTSSRGRPPVWMWEIQRRPKGLGVKVFGTDFNPKRQQSSLVKKHFARFLDDLAEEQRRA